MSEDPIPYVVGRGKPPRHSQFKKGQSGNPKGRIKEQRTLANDLTDALNEAVTINENGKKRRRSKQQVMIMALIHKGMKGDVRASSKVMDVLMKIAVMPHVIPVSEGVSALDESIIAAFIERHGERGNTSDET